MSELHEAIAQEAMDEALTCVDDAVKDVGDALDRLERAMEQVPHELADVLSGTYHELLEAQEMLEAIADHVVGDEDQV